MDQVVVNWVRLLFDNVKNIFLSFYITQYIVQKNIFKSESVIQIYKIWKQFLKKNYFELQNLKTNLRSRNKFWIMYSIIYIFLKMTS